MEEKWTYMDPKLYLAARSNNVEGFRSLVENNRSIVHQKTPRKMTVLHIAAKHGHEDMVKEIAIWCSSLYTEKDRSGFTPLHAAAWYGHLEVVKLLIEQARNVASADIEYMGKTKADEMLEARTLMGETALHWAVWHRHVDVVKKLTSACPHLVCVADNCDWSPLYSASSKGHLPIVEHILPVEVVRCPSFHQGPNGETPLHIAISERNEDVVDMLLKSFPEYARHTNYKGESPLQIAAERGILKVVRKLLQLDRSIAYQTDKSGNSPLHGASQGGHVKVFKEIIRFCPDSWSIKNQNKQNVLHTAVLSNHLALVEYILKNDELDLLIHARDKDGRTPLPLAVMKDHIWIVFLLLDDCRMMVRASDLEGKSSLEIISSKLEMGIPFSQKAAIWWAMTKAGNYHSINKADLHAIQTDISQEPTIKQLWVTTANTLLVVAALIATVSFAAIFTLPGGYDNSGKEAGLAHYRNKPLLQIFLLLDAFAMFTSLVTALLVIVANWTDSLGLKSMVPWALRMISLSFISMCSAFSWAVGLMMKYNWALWPISFLNVVFAGLVVCFFGFDSPAYRYWRVYAVFRKAKRFLKKCMHVNEMLIKEA